MLTEYKCFKQKGANCTLRGKPLKLVDQFTYLGSNISSTESHDNICKAKPRNVIDRLSIILKSNLSNKIKQDFFQTVTVSILKYRCTTWMLTKHIEKKLDEDDVKLLHMVLNKSWKQHPDKTAAWHLSRKQFKYDKEDL